MSTAQTLQIVSTSSDTTEKLAARLAVNLKGGEVIELVSDLGGGKTTFVRGLARGLGSSAHVSSPTFKISNEYTIPSAQGQTLRKVIHFDFYRLNDPGLVANELAEVLGDPETVTIIEWGQIVEHVLPPQRLTIIFTPTSETARQLTFIYALSLGYLLKSLK